MSGEEPSRELFLVNANGLHLRPASKFVALANGFRADIRVSVNGLPEGNGKSILDLAAQAAEKGARIRIRATGEDAAAAIEALAELIETGFGEIPRGA